MPPRKGKRSTDPIQEALREHKASWNEACSEFISSLIAGKQGINGRGNATHGLPPSNIKDPLPAEVGSFLQALSGQFQQLVSGAGAIVQQQEQYSEHRKKHIQKNPGSISSLPSNNPAAEALQHLGSTRNKMIEKYGSTPVSRLWQYVSSPFRKDPGTKKRVGLLTLGADIFYEFLDLDNIILTLDMDTMPEILSKYQMIVHNLSAFRQMLVSTDVPKLPEETISNPVNTVNTKEVVLEKPVEEPVENSIAINEPEEENKVPSQVPPLMLVPRPLPSQEEVSAHLIMIGGALMYIAGSSLSLLKEISPIKKGINQFRKEKNPVTQTLLYWEIDNKYKELLETVAANLDKEQNIEKREGLEKLISNASLSQDAIVKMAHNFVSRFLKKQLIKVRKSNPSAYPRLRASNGISNIKKLMQRILDQLETGLDEAAITKNLDAIDEQIKSIGSDITVLNSLYRQTFYDEYNSGKKDNGGRKHQDILTQVWKNRLKRDFSNHL